METTLEPRKEGAPPAVSYKIADVNGITSLTINLDGPGVLLELSDALAHAA